MRQATGQGTVQGVRHYLSCASDGVRLEYVVGDGYVPTERRAGESPDAFPRHVRMLVADGTPMGLRAVAKALEEMASHIEAVREGNRPYEHRTDEIVWEVP
jgi:hypothetical protein